MSSEIPDSGSKFYRDDWGTIYLTEWTSHVVDGIRIYDFSSVIKQPYVWNEVDQGYIQNKHVFRKGIVTYKRSIIEYFDDGYNIKSEGSEQKIEYFDTTFPCHPVPTDNFSHHLNEIVTDECTGLVTQGSCWCEPDGSVLWEAAPSSDEFDILSASQTLTWDNVFGSEPPIGTDDQEPELEQVATPVVDPGTGSYGDPVEPTVTCATSGAIIRYTTNGASVTGSSTIYDPDNKPFYDNNGVIDFKAKAFKDGMLASEEVYVIYTIEILANAPTFSLPSDTYTTPQNLEIYSQSGGTGTLRWQTGYAPTSGSSEYSEGIFIGWPSFYTGSYTIYAAEFDGDTQISELGAVTFTMTMEPTATPYFTGEVPGTFIRSEGQAITITLSTDNTTYFTTDDIEATDSSNVYTTGFELTKDSSSTQIIPIRARAYSGNPPSNELTGAFTLELQLNQPTFTSPSVAVDGGGGINFSGGTLTYIAAYDNVYTIRFDLLIGTNTYHLFHGPLAGGTLSLDAMLGQFTLDSGGDTIIGGENFSLTAFFTTGGAVPPHNSDTTPTENGTVLA